MTEAPPIVQPLVDRWGREAVIETWNEVWGCPLSWATDPREVIEVARILERKEGAGW